MKRLAFLALIAFGFSSAAQAEPVLGEGEGQGIRDSLDCYDQFRSGDMKAAVTFCTRAIASGELTGDELIGAYINRGVAFRNLGEYQRAVTDYSAALKYAPDDAMIYANRANARRELGELKSALADADRAVSLDATRPASFYTRGAVLEAAGRYDNARKDYMMALSLAPSNMEYQKKILLLDDKIAQETKTKRH
ncbi:MAG: tetratricopeptide repeat protein [Parvibaculum sp.]|nr:tetratricopeptide repeat protein [Parvibaculum sp.]